MAGVGSTYLTLADKLKQSEGDNNITSTIIELLSQTNELLTDAVAIECNDGSGHKTTIRNGLPSVIFRKLYQGIPASKSTTSQVRDTTGMLEALSEVDKTLVDLSGNPNQFRLNEAKAFLESMNNTCQETIFYGNTKTDLAKFDGLAARYGALSTDSKNIGSNIISASGSNSDNTSIWFVTWGDLHTHLIYPKGSKAGLQHDDMGEELVADSDGNKFKAYVDHWKWDIGLSVRDWRSTCRIANIDASNLQAGNVKIDEFMLDAYYKIRKYAKTGKTICYANSETLCNLHKIAKNKTNVHLSLREFQGEEVVSFLGKVPIKEADQILNTESAVTA